MQKQKKYSRKTSFDITSGSKKITVNVEQEARIRMPFNHAMDDYAGGFTVGYIQKQWEIHEGGEKFTEGVFGNDKYLNGMQVGFKIHPQFGAGFGINTGLFYEYCQATEKGSASEWNSALVYREHGLYMPAHLRFSMNFSRWFQLAFHGGIGLNYVVSGKLFDGNEDSERDSWDVYKGNDSWKRFNPMVEYGASIRIRRIQFDFTMSKGLRKWIKDGDDYMTVGRPMSLTTTICF